MVSVRLKWCFKGIVFFFLSLKYSALHQHSSKILTIQWGLPRRVSSVENPRVPLTGFNLGSVAEESSNDVYRGVCKSLTKCWDSEIHLVVSSEFWKSEVLLSSRAHWMVLPFLANVALTTLTGLFFGGRGIGL